MLLDTPVCDFGWQAPDFNLQDADGVNFNMQEHLSDQGLLIAFICNHCPYVQSIADRLAEDTKLLMSEGIGVLAIMSNDYQQVAADAPEKMKQFAKRFGFTFPYLVDQDQSVGKRYGAICTPDFFGFNREGELQYRGRLDSAGKRDSADRVPELVNAMRLIAATGKGPKEQNPSMGCSIKWR